MFDSDDDPTPNNVAWFSNGRFSEAFLVHGVEAWADRFEWY